MIRTKLFLQSIIPILTSSFLSSNTNCIGNRWQKEKINSIQTKQRTFGISRKNNEKDSDNSEKGRENSNLDRNPIDHGSSRNKGLDNSNSKDSTPSKSKKERERQKIPRAKVENRHPRKQEETNLTKIQREDQIPVVEEKHEEQFPIDTQPIKERSIASVASPLDIQPEPPVPSAPSIPSAPPIPLPKWSFLKNKNKEKIKKLRMKQKTYRLRNKYAVYKNA